jgi:hypothetical protein
MIKLANRRKMRGTSYIVIQRSLSTSSWLSIEMVGLVSGSVKIGPSKIPNRTIQFPWIMPILLQQVVHPISDLGHYRDRVQKVGASLEGVLSSALLPVRATGAATVGASTDASTSECIRNMCCHGSSWSLLGTRPRVRP